MPRYFFHVSHDQPEFRDAVGIELADDKEAWREATRACGEMIQEIDGKLPLGTDWTMEVNDVRGPIFVIRFGAEKLRS